jgi:general L-amino acid transport system substrate-binding protein
VLDPAPLSHAKVGASSEEAAKGPTDCLPIFGILSSWRQHRMVLALMALALAATGATAQTAPAGKTLEAVRARGHLICATADPLPGFAQQGADGIWSGFDVDLCRAVAAAVFGDPGKVEFRALLGDSRFALLQTGAVDLIARNSAWTMRRDTGYGASYVAASFFDGLAIMVPQSLGVVSAYELDNISVCVIDGGDDLVNLRDFFFQNQATYTEVLYEDREDLSVAYEAGLCGAVAAPASLLHAIRRSLAAPAVERILPERLSKDAFGPVVREDDDQWFNIVKWTLFSIIDAEELGVTSLNIDQMSASKTHSVRALLGIEGTFGPSLGLSADFIKNVIHAVGNYAEIFERNFGAPTGVEMPRGQNALWTKGGLLFAPPIR